MGIFGLSKKSLLGLILVAALSSGNSYAAKIVLGFEGIGDLTPINDFYNGGTDGVGNSGIDYGVQFSNDAKGIVDIDAGGSGNFANEPSSGTALIFQEGGVATMNVEAGFESGISFFYSSKADAIVNVYDGLDGTGNLLASLNLSTNFHNNSCTGDIFGDWCHWDPIGVKFYGKARSVVFAGPREFTFYDDITLGSTVPNDCKKDFRWHRRDRHFSDNDDISMDDEIRSECKDSRRQRRNRYSFR